MKNSTFKEIFTPDFFQFQNGAQTQPKNSIETPVVILCGGKGTRLYPLTLNTPKSLIPIHGAPFLGVQLNYLILQGAKDFHLCTGNLAKNIEEFCQIYLEHFETQWNHCPLILKFKADFPEFMSLWNPRDSKPKINLHPEDKPLGTLGALLNIKNQLPERFFLLYGDSFLPFNLKAFLQASNQNDLPKEACLLSYYHNKNSLDKSNVIVLGPLNKTKKAPFGGPQNRDTMNETFSKIDLLYYDKDNKLEQLKIFLAQNSLAQSTAQFTHIDYGISLLNKNALIPGTDLKEFYLHLSLEKKLYGIEAHQRFFEIGSFEGIKNFESLISN